MFIEGGVDAVEELAEGYLCEVVHPHEGVVVFCFAVGRGGGDGAGEHHRVFQARDAARWEVEFGEHIAGENVRVALKGTRSGAPFELETAPESAQDEVFAELVFLRCEFPGCELEKSEARWRERCAHSDQDLAAHARPADPFPAVKNPRELAPVKTC